MFKASLLAAALLLGASFAHAATIVVNGDFETVHGDGGSDIYGMTDYNSTGDTLSALADGTRSSSWDVFHAIPGWTKGDGTTGIEVQTTNALGIKPHSGDHYIELDSEGNRTQPSNSSMQQTVILDAGRYALSFWYRGRPGTTDGSNGITSAIGNGILDILEVNSGLDGLAKNDWTRITRRFTVDNDNTETTLVFAAVGRNDELGGFVDTVSISAIPLPAGAWLILSGLAGLGVMRRFKRG
ncbi:MAG: VPLPA-CTERM sorting domain-containing protein [Pseudomonadota bacterium]